MAALVVANILCSGIATLLVRRNGAKWTEITMSQKVITACAVVNALLILVVTAVSLTK